MKEKLGTISAKEETVIVIEEMREIGGAGSPRMKYIQYWSKDGKLIAEGPQNMWPLKER